MKDNLANFRPKPNQTQAKPDIGGGRQPIRVNADDLNNLKCHKCNGEIFEQAINMKILPAMMSPTGKQEVTPAPTIFCRKCKTPVEESIDALDK